MGKVKSIWKYEKIVLLVFYVLSIISLFLSNQLVKPEIIAHVNNNQLVGFVVNHNRFDSRVLVELFLKMLFLKEMLIFLITTCLLLFFFLMHRRVVRDGIGMVKLVFIILFFVCFYLLLFVDYTFMNHLGLLTKSLIVKYVLYLIVLTLFFSLFIWFVIEYINDRKKKKIAFITHESIRNLANKMIRHLITCILVLFFGIGTCIFLLSKTLQNIVFQLGIEKILGSQINIDVTKIFSLLPDLMEKIINIKYHPERIGIVTIDVETISQIIQEKLIANIQNYTKNVLLLLVNTGVFYLVFEFLNELYQYKKYQIHMLVYTLLFLLSVRIAIFTSHSIMFYIIDFVLLCAVFMYIATLIQWRNTLMTLIWLKYAVKRFVNKNEKRDIMKKIINIIIGTIITLFGLFLLFNGAAIQFFALYIGIIFLLVTIIGFILMKKFNFVEMPYGQFVLTGVFGLVFLFLTNVTYTIIVTLFTVICFLFSVFYIIKTFQSQNRKINHIFQIALSIIFIVYAIVMLLNPKLGGQTLSSILAIFMIMNGLSYFFINTDFLTE